ncbi:hypothetical protein L1987_47330 [Smallanthus sonchifolius]|uniref:Uncharacterized protein n=1 Tax=Smallanthus sonchifolius TaxID=185202 RepID=A0ACB9G380_9ASTR|nr:hypothetical protein L1987_47330 [Smallanthus sonchifolius]
MADLQFSILYNVCACLERNPRNEDFHSLIDFLERSPISFALQVAPTIYENHIRDFWASAAVIDGTSLQLDDVDGVSDCSFGCLTTCNQQIGYADAPVRGQFKKGLLPVPHTVELFDHMVGLSDDVDFPASPASEFSSSSEQVKYSHGDSESGDNSAADANQDIADESSIYIL